MDADPVDADLVQRCYHEIGHAVVGLRTGQTLLHVSVDAAGHGPRYGAAFERVRLTTETASLRYCARLYGGREAVALAVAAGRLPPSVDAEFGFAGTHPDCDEQRIAAEVERAGLVWGTAPPVMHRQARRAARVILARHWAPVLQGVQMLLRCQTLGACDLQELLG